MNTIHGWAARGPRQPLEPFSYDAGHCYECLITVNVPLDWAS